MQTEINIAKERSIDYANFKEKATWDMVGLGDKSCSVNFQSILSLQVFHKGVLKVIYDLFLVIEGSETDFLVEIANSMGKKPKVKLKQAMEGE